MKAGADVATLSAAPGWQPHTVRAAVTGLRRSGHVVVATKPAGGGAARYRIVAGAGAAEAGGTGSLEAGKGDAAAGETTLPDPETSGTEVTQTAEPAEPADAR